MITGAAKLAGVIGWPIEHSKSPVLHGHWLERYGIDGAYVPMAVPPKDLPRAVHGLRALGFRGCNVTVPHKQAVMTCCDRVEDDAKRIGAVNTLIVENDGTLVGRNTDGAGFLQNLKAAQTGWRPGMGPALVIGAGGAARAVLYALLEAGVPEIRLANRTLSRAEGLAAEFSPTIKPLTMSDAEGAMEGCALLVNTSSMGMTGQPPLDLRLDALPTGALVTDIVYAPLRTPLLEQAARRGNPTVDGLGMLLHQAAPGFEAWFGVRPQVDDALRAAVLAA